MLLMLLQVQDISVRCYSCCCRFSEMLLMLFQVQCDVTHVVTGSVRRYSCCYRFSEMLLMLLQVQ